MPDDPLFEDEAALVAAGGAAALVVVAALVAALLVVGFAAAFAGGLMLFAGVVAGVLVEASRLDCIFIFRGIIFTRKNEQQLTDDGLCLHLFWLG